MESDLHKRAKRGIDCVGGSSDPTSSPVSENPCTEYQEQAVNSERRVSESRVRKWRLIKVYATPGFFLIAMCIYSVFSLITFILSNPTSNQRLNFNKEQYLHMIKELNDWPSFETDSIKPGPCNIPVVDFNSFKQDHFINTYAFQSPLVVRNYFNNAKFAHNCTMKNLLEKFGHTQVLLSSANTNSYAKRKVTLQDYFSDYLSESQNVEKRGNETFYFFGDNNYTEWDPLFSLYHLPPYKLPNHSETISFGVASAGTGVPFHFHGPGFAETIFGRKRWFLTEPHVKPNFDGDTSSLKWFIEQYDDKDKLWECTLEPSDLIYFPDRWWHATLNIDTSVFVSTFLSPN